jgi:hypothetical protein
VAFSPRDVTQLRLSRQIRVEIASTVVPGALTLTAVWLLADSSPLRSTIFRRNANLNAAALFLAVVLALIGAYVAGVAARSFAWSVYRRILGWSAYRWFRRFALWGSNPVIEAWNDLTESFNCPELMRVQDSHSAFRSVLDKAKRAAATGVTGQAQTNALDYAKYWLREHHPDLAVDHHEVEISFWVAVAVPLFVAPYAVATRFWPQNATTPTMVTATAVAIFLAVTAFSRARRRTVEEFSDALRTFHMAYWFDETGAGAATGQIKGDAKP